MSFDLIVYLRRSAMPTSSAWKLAILKAGFPLEFQDDFDVEGTSGFVPCLYQGLLSGFEYYASSLTPEEAADLAAPMGADFSVTVSCGADQREFACSAVAAGVLANLCDGLLIDPQLGQSFQASDALNWARQQLTRLE
jgi:hypothetical protein